MTQRPGFGDSSKDPLGPLGTTWGTTWDSLPHSRGQRVGSGRAGTQIHRAPNSNPQAPKFAMANPWRIFKSTGTGGSPRTRGEFPNLVDLSSRG